MQINQVDATTNSECNSLVASKPQGCMTEGTQQLIAEASFVARKCHDKVGRFKE
jgi:hypothetical protein